MEPLIRFRSLWSKLTTDERLKVLEKNMDSLDTMIFNHYSNYSDKNDIQIDYNQTMTQIIQTRSSNGTSQTNKTTQIKATHISDLSQHLVQYIASFLDLESYARFECSDRFIFIALRSVSTLQQIYDVPAKMVDYIESLSIQQTTLLFKRFAKITKLRIENTILLRPNIYWNRVKQLTLDWSAWDDEHVEDLEQFLLAKPFDASRIEELSLVMVIADEIPSLGIIELLKECDSLRRLYFGPMCDDWRANDMDNILRVQSFANVKHLTIVCTENMDPLIKRISEQLVTLHIDEPQAELHSLVDPHIKFANLRHFTIGGVVGWDAKILLNMLQKPTIDHLTLKATDMFGECTDDEIMELFKILLSKKNLTYLGFYALTIRAWLRIVSVMDLLLRPTEEKQQYVLSHGLLFNLELRDWHWAMYHDPIAPTEPFCDTYESFSKSLASWTQQKFKLILDFRHFEYTNGIAKWNIPRLIDFFSLEMPQKMDQESNSICITEVSSQFKKHSCSLCCQRSCC